MKTSVKKLSETKVVLTISVGPEELKTAEQVALTKLAKEIKIPGFRKGNIPPSVVAKNVDQITLQQQTLDDALSKAVAEAFTSKDLQPLDRPEVDVKKFEPGKELEFTAEVEVLPKVKLGDYKKLQAKPATTKVAKKDIDEIINRMRQNFAEKSEVKRATKTGDEVVIDFVGKKDDVAFEGGTAKDFNLELGSGQFIPGFEEGVVGHKAGEEFDLPLKFPEDYHSKDLKGADVVFTVTLKTVNEKKLPEVNDEFAAKCGPFTTPEELENDIKRELTAQKDREANEKLKDELVKELVEKSEVPVPETLVKDQERSIEQDFTQNLMYQGINLDSYLEMNKFKTKEEWLDKEVGPAAISRVKAGLVLAELSKELKIDASKEELEAHIGLYKQQYGKDADALKQFDQPEVQRDIANRLLTEKTVDKLVELNTK